MLPRKCRRISGPGSGKLGVRDDVIDGLPDEACERLIERGIAEPFVEELDPSLPPDTKPGEVEDAEAYAAAIASGEIAEIPALPEKLPKVDDLGEHLADKPRAYVEAMQAIDSRVTAEDVYTAALEALD